MTIDSTSLKFYKAVSLIDGEYYTLGMGKAKVIHLPKDEWIEGGKHGISCSTTPSGAKSIIYQANRRKTLPVPKNMIVRQGIPKETYGWGKVVCSKVRPLK